MLSTPTGVETPDVIDLRKQQRKEPEKPLYQVIYLCILDVALLLPNITHIFVIFFLQVLEEKEERIAPGTLLGTSHT